MSDASGQRSWVRQQLDDMKWDFKFGARFVSNGDDETGSLLSDKLRRIRHALMIVRKREED